MEKEISTPLGSFITQKTAQLSINKQHRTDLDEILKTSHQLVRQVRRKVSYRLTNVSLLFRLASRRLFEFVRRVWRFAGISSSSQSLRSRIDWRQ